MFNVIHKVCLSMTYSQTRKLPRDSQILKIDEQHCNLCIWYCFNQAVAEDRVERTFKIYGTGHDINAADKYLGTVVMNNGLVWHVFEETDM